MEERRVGKEPDRMPDQSRVIDVFVELRSFCENIDIADAFERRSIRPFPPIDPPEPLDKSIDGCRLGEAHVIVDVEGDFNGLGADEKVL